jgi:hypothetical protein
MHFRIVLNFLKILKGKRNLKNGAQYWASLRQMAFGLEVVAAWSGLQAERLHGPGFGGPRPRAGAVCRPMEPDAQGVRDACGHRGQHGARRLVGGRMGTISS